jgi:hypothetical protein
LREDRRVASGAFIAPEQRITDRRPIVAHGDERRSMPAHGDGAHFDPAGTAFCGGDRLARCGRDCTPPLIWILLGGTAFVGTLDAT